MDCLTDDHSTQSERSSTPFLWAWKAGHLNRIGASPSWTPGGERERSSSRNRRAHGGWGKSLLQVDNQ